jgi:hypothetical protein
MHFNVRRLAFYAFIPIGLIARQNEPPRCGADLEIISSLLDPEQISRYLKYVGMPAAPPPRAGIKMKGLCGDWCQEAVKVSAWQRGPLRLRKKFNQL